MLGSQAQDQQVDSVLRILKKRTHDTTEVKALLWLGVHASKNDLQATRRYFKQALRLAEKISSRPYMAESLIELGGRYHADGQSDSSLFFHRRALQVSPVRTVYVIDAYRGIALNLLWLSRFDSARFYLGQALNVAQDIRDHASQADIYNELGNLALQEDNNLEALRLYLLSAKLQDSLLHDDVGLARAWLNIGNIQYRLKNSEKAIQYTTQARELAKKSHYDKGVAYASQLMGRIYRSQEKFDEALVEFTNAMNQYRRMGDRRSAAETELSVGNSSFDRSDFRAAERHYLHALGEAKSINNETLQMYSFSALGHVFFELKQYEKSTAYVDSSRVTAVNLNLQYGVLDAYEMLRGIHENQHHYKEALDYAMLYASLKDSLTRAESHAEVEELEIKYQNEKKAAEIELLKSDKNLQEVMISNQRTIHVATVVVLILVIVVAFILVNRYRVVNHAKRLVEIERVRNGIARDLHDDIGSTLSSINILSQVALTEKNGNVESYLQRIGDQSSRMMEDIGDIVWSINPNNDSMAKVVVRMREFATEILEPRNITFRFTEQLSGDLSLDADKRKNLFLIFKESVNNAAKYSDASLLEISLVQEDHSIIMRVKDNGRGFTEHAIKPGNGLKNLQERAREVKGAIQIKSELKQGTEIELRLSLA